MSLRLAVATDDFETSLRGAIAQAGTAQVDGIRLNARHDLLGDDISASGLRQLNQYVRENRMQVAGLSCPTRHRLADPNYLDERVRLVRSAMELARPLQTKSLIVPCGLIPDPDRTATRPPSTLQNADDRANPFSFATAPPAQTSLADEFSTLCEVASDLARHGNHVGCILTLQLPNYDIPLIERLIDSVTTGPIQIAFDPAIAIFNGGNPVTDYRNLYQYTGHVRARDGVHNTDMSGTETALGDGTVDWDEILPTLIEADFTGWVCVERTGGDHRATDVLQGVERVKSLLPQPTDG